MKGSRVYLRIEEETKEKWVTKAKKRGLTLSEYVRTLVDPEDEAKEKKVVIKAENEVVPVVEYKAEVPFKSYFK